MKYCTKCGKELMDEAVICPGCGCQCETKKESPIQKSSAEKTLSNATSFMIGGVVIMVFALLITLYRNIWIGAILFIGATILLSVPATNLSKAVKAANPNLPKNEFKKVANEAYKEAKKQYPILGVCRILQIISAVCLIITAVLFM